MRRILILAVLVLLSFPFSSGLFALAEGSDRFAVSLDPIPVFFSVFHLSFQVAVSDMISIPVFYTGCFFPSLEEYHIGMQSVSVGMRLYPTKTVHRGFYIGPFLNCNRVSNGTVKGSLFGYGIESGAMVDMGSGFFIDLGMGLVRYNTKPGFDNGVFTIVMPVFNMGFGYKWGRTRAVQTADASGENI
ncbi:MAG: hypothetical protein LBC99_10505 [Spirochaetota bacterium]|jgi:hypothetical protein|nr:hypothetical protein [Spirochaetota bacterium]